MLRRMEKGLISWCPRVDTGLGMGDNFTLEMPMTESDHSHDLPDFETYTRRMWRGPKLWVALALIAASVLLYFGYRSSVVRAAMSQDEIRDSVEFFSISSSWIVKEEVKTDEFTGVILVPQISFRIRNRGERNLGPIFLLGVFSFMDTGKTMGEGYGMFLKKSLPPGGESESITLTSGFGYRASSAEAFEKNRTDWRPAFVEMFVRSGPSKLTLLKSFYISQKIRGMNIDVRI